MNNEQAKKILALFRPGTPDRTDPAFTEALEAVKPPTTQTRWQEPPNAELSRWFQEHRSSHLSIRAKFLMIPVPPAVKDRILAERKTPAIKVVPLRPNVYLAAAVLVICLGLAGYFLRSQLRPGDFETYRSRMARTALQPYSMDVHSHDLQKVNAYLAGQKAPSDYVLPGGMLKAQLVGCAVLHWQGGPVSMICFHSGRPLSAGEGSDLWLFVSDLTSVRGGPSTDSPVIAPAIKLTTASWVQDGKLYILAGAGDEAFLRKFL